MEGRIEKEVEGIIERNINWKYKKVSLIGSKKKIRLSKEDALSAEVVVAYDERTDLFIAWNGVIHNSVVKGDTHDFTVPIGKRTHEDVKGMEPIYKKLQGSGKKEKVLLIVPTYILRFLQAPFSYLLPNPDDENYESNTLFATPNSPEPQLIAEFESKNKLWILEERKRHSCTAANRDAFFRKKVFSKYKHPKCIVCGIDIIDVLQAAHINAVKDLGSDEPENGVCLCANHHLLFDKGYFKINPETEEIYDIDSSMASYLSLLF